MKWIIVIAISLGVGYFAGYSGALSSMAKLAQQNPGLQHEIQHAAGKLGAAAKR